MRSMNTLYSWMYWNAFHEYRECILWMYWNAFHEYRECILWMYWNAFHEYSVFIGMHSTPGSLGATQCIVFISPMADHCGMDCSWVQWNTAVGVMNTMDLWTQLCSHCVHNCVPIVFMGAMEYSHRSYEYNGLMNTIHRIPPIVFISPMNTIGLMNTWLQ